MAIEISPQRVAEIIKKSACARQEALEEAANAARTLVQSGVTPDGIYHTIRALQQHTMDVVYGGGRNAGKSHESMLHKLKSAIVDAYEYGVCVKSRYMTRGDKWRIKHKEAIDFALAALEDGETKL